MYMRLYGFTVIRGSRALTVKSHRPDTVHALLKSHRTKLDTTFNTRPTISLHSLTNSTMLPPCTHTKRRSCRTRLKSQSSPPQDRRDPVARDDCLRPRLGWPCPRRPPGEKRCARLFVTLLKLSDIAENGAYSSPPCCPCWRRLP